MRVAVIGYNGYWGQKLTKIASDMGWTVEGYNSQNIDSFPDSDMDHAIIASPPALHYKHAKMALELGMDVFVEKPFTMCSSHAEELIRIANKNQAVIFVDSTFLYTEAFNWLRRKNEPISSFQSQRLSPPMPQAKINAGWDMIWHDLSILDGLNVLPDAPEGVGAVDGSIATAALPLKSGGSAFIMTSRLWPNKIRDMVLHYSNSAYTWNLAGLRDHNNQVILESIGSLDMALMQFENCCKDRVLRHLSDGCHGLRIIKHLEKLFPSSHSAEFQELKCWRSKRLQRS